MLGHPANRRRRFLPDRAHAVVKPAIPMMYFMSEIDLGDSNKHDGREGRVARVGVDRVGFGIERRPVIGAAAGGAERQRRQKVRWRLCTTGGVNTGPILYLADVLVSACRCSSGVKSTMSASGDAVAGVSRWFHREGLRFGIPLARDVAHFNRPFFHRPNTGLPVVRSNTYRKPCFEGCATALTVLSVYHDVHQQRRGGNIHVPQRVVDQLVMPLLPRRF